MNISIVIPVFPPHFIHLETCLKNIMESTIMPKEIIIAASEMNNESKDTLYNKLQHITNNLTKLIITNTEEKAFSGINRNRGVEFSSGEIIVFIDADDFTHRQKIEIIDFIFKKHLDCKMLLHNYTKNNNFEISNYDLNKLNEFKYLGGFEKTDIVKNNMNRIHRGHSTIKKSVFNLVQFKNEMHREDNIFTKKVHQIFNSSYFVPIELMIYNETGIPFRENYYKNS